MVTSPSRDADAAGAAETSTSDSVSRRHLLVSFSSTLGEPRLEGTGESESEVVRFVVSTLARPKSAGTGESESVASRFEASMAVVNTDMTTTRAGLT